MSREDWYTPEHRTNILPLRWLANYILHPISMWFFRIGLRYNDKIEWDRDYRWHNRLMESFGFKMYKFFNYPYDLWGTVYVINLEKMKELNDMDLSGKGWDDYDEFGVPYWEKFGLIEQDTTYKWEDDATYIDPETGDGFKVIDNVNSNNIS